MRVFPSRLRWSALVFLLGVAGLGAAPLLAADGPFARLFEWMGNKTREPIRRGANEDSHRYLELSRRTANLPRRSAHYGQAITCLAEDPAAELRSADY